VTTPGARLRRALTEPWPLGREPEPLRTAPGLLLALVWVTLVLPELVRSFLEPKVWRPVTDGENELTGVLDTLVSVCNVVLVLGCALAVLANLRRLPWRGVLPLLILGAAWLATVVPLLLADRPPRLAAVLVPTVATAVWAVRPQRGHVAVLGHATGLLALASLALGVLWPRGAIFERSALVEGEKAVSPWGILAGVLQTGNLLGLALALGVPSLLYVHRGWLRWTYLGATALAIAWSASRTGMIAVLLVALAALGLVLVREPRRLALPWLAALALGALLLPFVVRVPTAFTNRGGYWISSLDAWRESPWTGHGADWFKVLAQGEENLGGHAYHAHNQVVQVLVTGGALLMVLALAVLLVLGRRAVAWAGRGWAWPTLVLTALAVVASFEVPLGLVDRTGYVPFAMLPLAVLAFVEPERE